MKIIEALNCLGRWSPVDADLIENYIRSAIKHSENKGSPLSRNEIFTRMDNGEVVRTGTDWYDQIRYTPPERPKPAQELVKCTCGHSVPRISVMHASRGTACPDCYDRMSD